MELFDEERARHELIHRVLPKGDLRDAPEGRGEPSAHQAAPGTGAADAHDPQEGSADPPGRLGLENVQIGHCGSVQAQVPSVEHGVREHLRTFRKLAVLLDPAQVAAEGCEGL